MSLLTTLHWNCQAFNAPTCSTRRDRVGSRKEWKGRTGSDQSDVVDVGTVSVPGGGGVLPEDESGVCGFGVGDIRTAPGGGSECDIGGRSGAGSGRTVAQFGGSGGDADGGGAVAAAGLARSWSATARAGAETEAVDVQRRGAEWGTGAALPGRVCRSDAVEHLRSVGSSGGCDVARS